MPLLGYRFVFASVFLFGLAEGHEATHGAGQDARLETPATGRHRFRRRVPLFFIAIDLAPAGVASLVFFSFPMLTALISWVLRIEPITRRT